MFKTTATRQGATMLQFKAQGKRELPVASLRQQRRHRVESATLLNVSAVFVLLMATFGLLLQMAMPTLLQVAGQVSSIQLRDEWTAVREDAIYLLAASIMPAVVVAAVMVLPLILYVRFLVAVLDLHGSQQRRRLAAAWVKGVRSLRSSPISRSSAIANAVCALGMIAMVLTVVIGTWPAEQFGPLLSEYPIPMTILGAGVLSGLLVRMADEVELVHWVARSVSTLLPRTRSVVPATRLSMRCAICDERVLPRPILTRITKDFRRASTKVLRTSRNPVARALRRCGRYIGSNPLKIILLILVVFPAAIHISVEEYTLILASVIALVVICRIYTRYIGLMLFPFSAEPGIGLVVGGLLALLALFVNCMLIFHVVGWGAEMVTSWGWQFDENYAALFLFSSEAVALVATFSLLGVRVRGIAPIRPSHVLGRSVLPLLSLLLAAVVAPWAATFTAFLIGQDFGKSAGSRTDLGQALTAPAADTPAASPRTPRSRARRSC